MFEKNSERRFDVRIIQRNLDQGLITREEYDKHIAALEDKAEHSAQFEVDFVENILIDEADTKR